MKTMISVFILFTGSFILSCNQKQSPQQINTGTDGQPLSDSTLRASWQVTGCAEKAAVTKSPATGNYQEFPEQQGVPGPAIRVAGDSVTYTRVVSHLCCRQVTVSTKREQQTITITEYWFRPGCKCRCSSTVNAVIHQLPKGEYRIYAIEKGTDPVDDKPVSIADTLLRERITIQ